MHGQFGLVGTPATDAATLCAHSCLPTFSPGERERARALRSVCDRLAAYGELGNVARDTDVHCDNFSHWIAVRRWVTNTPISLSTSSVGTVLSSIRHHPLHVLVFVYSDDRRRANIIIVTITLSSSYLRDAVLQ